MGKNVAKDISDKLAPIHELMAKRNGQLTKDDFDRIREDLLDQGFQVETTPSLGKFDPSDAALHTQMVDLGGGAAGKGDAEFERNARREKYRRHQEWLRSRTPQVEAPRQHRPTAVGPRPLPAKKPGHPSR